MHLARVQYDPALDDGNMHAWHTRFTFQLLSMGWGLAKKDRTALLGPLVCKPACKGTTSTVVLDMPAAIRLYARGSRGPQEIASQIIRVATPAAVERLFAVFDKASAMPKIRGLCSAERYSRIVPHTAEEERELLEATKDAVHHLPARKKAVDYDAMFKPGKTKERMWAIMSAATWHAVASRCKHMYAEVHGPVGEVHTVNGKSHSHGSAFNHTYQTETSGLGEADLATFRIAALEARGGRSVTLRSVDTDLILQTVASGTFDGTPFVPEEPFLLRLKTETIDGQALVDRFGSEDPSKRLSAAFWLIMAGGTDYSKPASDQGYLKNALAQLAVGGSTPAFEVSAGKTTLLVAKILSALGKVKRRKTKDGGASAGKKRAAPKPSRTLKTAIFEAARSTVYYGGICPTGVIPNHWSLAEQRVQLLP